MTTSYELWKNTKFHAETSNIAKPSLIITEKQQDDDIHIIISNASNYIKHYTGKTLDIDIKRVYALYEDEVRKVDTSQTKRKFNHITGKYDVDELINNIRQNIRNNVQNRIVRSNNHMVNNILHVRETHHNIWNRHEGYAQVRSSNSILAGDKSLSKKNNSVQMDIKPSY